VIKFRFDNTPYALITCILCHRQRQWVARLTNRLTDRTTPATRPRPVVETVNGRRLGTNERTDGQILREMRVSSQYIAAGFSSGHLFSRRARWQFEYFRVDDRWLRAVIVYHSGRLCCSGRLTSTTGHIQMPDWREQLKMSYHLPSDSIPLVIQLHIASENKGGLEKLCYIWHWWRNERWSTWKCNASPIR
jgi:hypothetical protein